MCIHTYIHINIHIRTHTYIYTHTLTNTYRLTHPQAYNANVHTEHSVVPPNTEKPWTHIYMVPF